MNARLWSTLQLYKHHTRKHYIFTTRALVGISNSRTHTPFIHDSVPYAYIIETSEQQKSNKIKNIS